MSYQDEESVGGRYAPGRIYKQNPTHRSLISASLKNYHQIAKACMASTLNGASRKNLKTKHQAKAIIGSEGFKELSAIGQPCLKNSKTKATIIKNYLYRKKLAAENALRQGQYDDWIEDFKDENSTIPDEDNYNLFNKTKKNPKGLNESIDEQEERKNKELADSLQALYDRNKKREQAMLKEEEQKLAARLMNETMNKYMKRSRFSDLKHFASEYKKARVNKVVDQKDNDEIPLVNNRRRGRPKGKSSLTEGEKLQLEYINSHNK